MAASTVLPTYQRYINGAPVSAAGRKTLRLREKYIVLLVLGTFVAVCIGTFFFLPELRSGSINSAYRHIRNAGSDLLLPPLQVVDKAVLQPHDVNNVDPHVIMDRAKLILKIQEDLEKERQKNLKENMDKAQDQFVNDVAQIPITVSKNDPGASELNDIVRDHPGGPGTRGGEPSDPDIREKRNKIKESTKLH
ncbi:Mannosyl-oligosaccharide like protein [Argiope bruennichi]|uniref:Mannosyl-oligosaccharide like protein n=1 Tax=Argiope bruennichi TaxID=94029 RepID=A0A8T0ETN7_ARGBR|nr:Mannosyl-oligosaccharide like protein [Argiope bruennichi]